MLNTSDDDLKVPSEVLRAFYRRKYEAVIERTVLKNVNGESICVDLKKSSLWEEGDSWKRFVDREHYMWQHQTDEKNKEIKGFFKDNERFVIVSGIAGIGKTTLLLHGLMKWVEKNHWDDFDFVFHIQCREINYLHADCNNMKDLLKKLFPDVMSKISFSTLKEISNRLLFLVDGIDEFQFLEELLLIRSRGENVAPVVKALYDVMNLQSKHCLLVAGRPEAAWKIKRKLSSNGLLCIDVIGFSENSKDEYITNRACENVELKSQIKDTIEQSPSVQLMATVPIYLEVMCSVLETNKEATFSTLTELYVWVLFYHVRKHFRGKSDSRFINMSIHELFHQSEVMETLNCACKMAYTMLHEGRVVFHSQSFGKIPGESLEHCGLVTKVKLSEFEEAYQFRHLSIIEFCSAIYMFKNLSDQFESLLMERHLEGCIPIVCGLEGAVLSNISTPLVVKTFVGSLKLQYQSTNWMRCLLTDNKEDDINYMDDMFHLSFIESRSSITDEFKERYTRTYLYDIDDADAVRESRRFYFARNLFECGCLNLRTIGVDCARNMPYEKQIIVTKMFCSVEEVLVHNMPLNFDAELFTRTYSQQHSPNPLLTRTHLRKSLPKKLKFYYVTIEQFRCLLPIIDVVEELEIVFLQHYDEHTSGRLGGDLLEMKDAIVSSGSLNRIVVYIFKRYTQHVDLFVAMTREIVEKGMEVDLKM